MDTSYDKKLEKNDIKKFNQIHFFPYFNTNSFYDCFDLFSFNICFSLKKVD